MKLTKEQIELIKRKSLEAWEKIQRDKWEIFRNSKEGKKEIKDFVKSNYTMESIKNIIDENTYLEIKYRTEKGGMWRTVVILHDTTDEDIYKRDIRSSYYTKFELDYTLRNKKAVKIREALIMKSIDSKDIDVEALIKELSEL